MIIRKNRNELEKMRRSGLLVWQILQDLSKDGGRRRYHLDLEVAAEKMMADAGAKPAFKGYYDAGGGQQVSVCAVHFGERGDRAWDAVAEDES